MFFTTKKSSQRHSRSAFIISDHRTRNNLSITRAVWAFWENNILSIASTHTHLIVTLSVYRQVHCKASSIDVEVLQSSEDYWRFVLPGHGPLTGRCVRADRQGQGEQAQVTHVCEIQSWCPVEDDRRILGKTRCENQIDWLVQLYYGVKWFIYQEGRIPLNFSISL